MIKQHHLLSWSGQGFRQLTPIVPAGEGNSSQAWYCMSVIPDMRLRQEDGEYIVRPCLRKVQVFRKRLLTARRLAASFRSLTVSLFELNKKCYSL